MRADLIQVAEEVVEALAVRDAGRVDLAEAPFADEAGAVANPFEHFGDRGVLGPQRDKSVAADVSMAGVFAGHQTAARRGTNRTAGVALREAHTLGGQAIEVRRLNLLLAVAADIAVALII